MANFCGHFSEVSRNRLRIKYVLFPDVRLPAGFTYTIAAYLAFNIEAFNQRPVHLYTPFELNFCCCLSS